MLRHSNGTVTIEYSNIALFISALLLGKQTVANRPYELGLSLEYNKYTLERAQMGWGADENGPAKAFSQLKITSYQDSINHETWLTS